MVEQRDIDIIFRNPINWERFRNKTILVTGATGRLGMYIVEALIKADIDWNLSLNILALARDEKKLRQLLGNSLELPNVHILVQDITEPIQWKTDIHYIFIQQVLPVLWISQTIQWILYGGMCRELVIY